MENKTVLQKRLLQCQETNIYKHTFLHQRGVKNSKRGTMIEKAVLFKQIAKEVFLMKLSRNLDEVKELGMNT